MARKFVKFDTGYRPNAPQNVLDKTIDELNLHDETKNKLRGAELMTVGEIASYEMRHLYRIDRMGRGDVFAVLRALKSLGVDFKPSEPKKSNDAIAANANLSVESANVNNAGSKHSNRDNRRDNECNVIKQEGRNEHRTDERNRNKRENVAPTHNSKVDRNESDKNRRRERDRRGKDRSNENVAGERINASSANVERQKVNTRDYDMYGNKRKNADAADNKRGSQRNASAIQKPQPIKLPPLKNADGLYKFFKAGKWGYKNEAGNVVIEPQFDEAYNFSEGLAAVEQQEKVGFINTAGELVIPYRYDTVCSFSEGLASVTLDDKCAYIDKEGNEAFGFDYEAATSFVNDISLVKKDGKWGYMDRHTGEIRLR